MRVGAKTLTNRRSQGVGIKGLEIHLLRVGQSAARGRPPQPAPAPGKSPQKVTLASFKLKLTVWLSLADWKEIGFDIDEVIAAEEKSKKDKK